MHKLRYILVLLPLAFCLSPLQAQVDTEFWFAAPRLTPAHWDATSKVELVVVAYDEDAEVTISQPAAGRTLVANRPVLRGNVFTYVISNAYSNFRDLIETPADEQVHNTGICVQSTTPVGVYYAVTEPNSEVYTLKGRHGCGTQFVVPMQTNHRLTKRNDRPAYDPYCSIEVVATEDNTVITFTAPVPTNYSATAGVVHTVTLNKGQTYAISSRESGTLAAGHLGGTVITANKPILVNSTDDSVSISTNDTPAETGYEADLVGEQIVPTERAGSEYIAPTNGTDHEYLYLFAAANDDTQPLTVQVQSGTQPPATCTLSPGAPAIYKAANGVQDVVYVSSQDGRPFICFQLTTKGTELSGTIMPSLNCSGSQEVTYVPILTNTGAEFNVITRTANVDGFLVNDMPHTALEAADFSPVPGAPQWSYAHASLPAMNGYAGFTIRNTKGVFHTGALDGTNGTSSYGFFSNFGQISLYAAPNAPSYTIGDRVQLLLTAAEEFDEIHWYRDSISPGSEIQFANPASPVLDNVTTADAGRYIVEASHREGCPVSPDTFYVTVLSAEETIVRDTVCQGTAFALTASGVGNYTWLLDDEEVGYDRHLLVAPDESATYVVAENCQGVSRIDWTDTTQLTLPNQDSLVLFKQRVDNLIPDASYCWSLHFVSPQNNTVSPKVHVYVGDSLLDRFVVPNGRSGVDTTYILTVPAGQDELYLRVYVVSPRSTQYLALTHMQLVPMVPMWEVFEVQVDAALTADITYQPAGASAPVTTAPYELTRGDSAVLSVAGADGVDTYRWSTGDTTASVTITTPGTYVVNIYRGMCMTEAQIEVTGVLPPAECPVPQETDTMYVQLCDTIGSFRWRGQDYTQTGLYRDTLRQTLWDGTVCDSLYYTLSLEVVECLPPVIVTPDPVCPDPEWADAWEVVMCDTLLPYRWRGKYYSEAGTYGDTLRQTNADGSVCDIRYFELHLTVVTCVPHVDRLDVAVDELHYELCDGDEEWLIPYRELVGEADAVELTDGVQQQIIPLTGDGYVHVPLTPGQVGDYNLSLVFLDRAHNLRVAPVQVTYTVLYDPLRVFAHLWNYVLAIYSPAYSGYPAEVWTAYSWYRDGEPLGETGSYYHVAEGELQAGACYRVRLTRQRDGAEVWTCPYCIEPTHQAPAEPNDTAPTVTKTLRDGRIIIHRQGADYTPLGQLAE